MKTDFDIRIHVELGVTPELTQLVKSILGPRVTGEPRAEEPAADAPGTAADAELLAEAPAAEQPKGERKRRSRKKDEALAAEEALAEETTGTVANEGQAAEAPAEESKPEAKEEPTPEKPKELTEQDIRGAMDKTRKRIEGEDYKDNTESEGYQKYHRQLTSMFKNIAAELGAEKPSALPAEQRQAFITECDLLQVMEDGTIGKIEAF